MRSTERRTETVEREVEVGPPICDCCGRKFDEASGGGYRVLIEIKRTYYDGSGESETFDCCVSCWHKSIKPLFKTGPRRADW